VICGRSVVFSGYSGFHHQWNWPQRYNWSIVESGGKHHNTNLRCNNSCLSQRMGMKDRSRPFLAATMPLLLFEIYICGPLVVRSVALFLVRYPLWAIVIFPPPIKKRHPLSTTWGRVRQSASWVQGTINNMHTEKRHRKKWIQLLYDQENHGLWTWLVSCKRQELPTLRKHLRSSPVFGASLLLIFLVFCVVFCLSSSCRLCDQCCQCL